ncbi:vesicle-associated membrane protein 4-like [Littorina saxatilis]|uniref:V-SNARE coiled-coil homology domain-containing protein n=1 Tax=Littorina saxatilis TaxID=31220 RepID=A0AAN9AX69_9CAEN
MPPKFARIPGSNDRAASADIERRGLLDGDSDDEDFFLRGPKVGGNLRGDPKMSHLRGQVDEVVGIMKDNVNRVAERGDRLEDLQSASDSLVNNADMFRSRSKSLHHNMWWKNCRMRILIAIVILVLVLIVIIPIIIHYKSEEEDNNGGN